jgi:hypothetical protein
MTNKELYKYLGEHTVDNIPYLNAGEFKYVTDKYGKEVCRRTLADYIEQNPSKFPFNPISYEDMVKNFHKLCKADYSKFLNPSSEEVDANVLEKYDDYKYSYHKYPLGIIDGPSAPFNKVADYFMRPVRYECSSQTNKSPVEQWEQGNIWLATGALWRGVNQVHYDDEGLCISGELSKNSYLMAMRMGAYIATQFKPVVAKSIYEMTDASKVLDTSMGWGDRLTGFFSSRCSTEYVGCDPNPNTFKVYKVMALEYSKLLNNKYTIESDTDDLFILKGDKKSVTFYRSGAENIPWSDIKNIDCAFTSPPYFSTELYNKGGDHEEDQSWSKFNEYESWRDDFYLPVAQNSFDSLSRTGFLFVNIMDPKIKSTRHRSCDELVDHIGAGNFIGQIGMKIQQRAQGKKFFESNEEQGTLEEYLAKTYIENVWCFSKVMSPIDVFRDARSTSLDDFF